MLPLEVQSLVQNRKGVYHIQFLETSKATPPSLHNDNAIRLTPAPTHPR